MKKPGGEALILVVYVVSTLAAIAPVDHNRQRTEARKALGEPIAIQRQLMVEMPSDDSEKKQMQFSQKTLAALEGN